MSASTHLQSIADAIVVRLATVTDLTKVYSYEPRDLDSLPAASVLGPTTMERTGLDEAESQLGSNDWRTTWTVRVYCAMDDPKTGQEQARSLLGQVVAAIDSDRQLANLALDSSVESAEIGFSDSDEAHQRQMVIAECAVGVWTLYS